MTFLRGTAPVPIGPPAAIAPTMTFHLPDADVPTEDGAFSFADSWSMADMSSTEAELIALRSSSELINPSYYDMHDIDGHMYPNGVFGPVTARAIGNQRDRDFPFPPTPPTFPTARQRAEMDAAENASNSVNVVSVLPPPPVIVPPVVIPVLQVEISPFAEILRIIEDPVYDIAGKGTLARAINMREAVINGDIRAIHIKIRREHVARSGTGWRSSLVTLGEAYSYGITVAFLTYSGGKYHLAANCSMMHQSTPQRYWGMNLDSEVILPALIG